MRIRRIWQVTAAVLGAVGMVLAVGTARGDDTGRPRPVRPRTPTGGWRTVNDDGKVYLTTNRASDLDLEVEGGARILKYSDGQYVHAIHKQYPQVCGAASLAMVLRQLGVADPRRSAPSRPGMVLARRFFRKPADVDGGSGPMVDLGYPGSMEHLMYLGYHRRRINIDGGSWNAGRPQFMSREGVLNVALTDRLKTDFDGTRLDYYAGTHIPRWMWHGPAIGYIAGDDFYTMLSGIMNYHFSGRNNGPWRDAMPLSFGSGTDADIVRYRRIVKGFIDHGLSVVMGVDGGGHFNTLIGYRGSVSPASAPFWVYSADPLDGWGRDANRQPLRWRRTPLRAASTRAGSGALVGIVAWNHHADGGASLQFRRGGWASAVDRANGNEWLTGASRQPTEHDPLNSPLAQPAERMP